MRRGSGLKDRTVALPTSFTGCTSAIVAEEEEVGMVEEEATSLLTSLLFFPELTSNGTRSVLCIMLAW
jgi:hypothetical protein